MKHLERIARDLHLPYVEEDLASGRIALSPAAERVLGVGFDEGLVGALTQLTGVSPEALAALIADAHQLGHAHATFPSCRLTTWVEQGVVRAIALPIDESQQELHRVATINHEMANGLTAIATLASVAARREQTGEALAMALGQIREAANATLEVVRSTRRTLEADPVGGIAFDVAPLLRDLLSTLRPMAENKGVQLETRIDDGLSVETRPTDLRSILWNLVKNALEALDRGGRVRVAASAIDERVRIIVDDDGPGMDEETQRRAFDPFYTTKPEGSGLGLPLVKHLVQRLEGELIVESALQEGARFVLSLPLADPANTMPVVSGVRARTPLLGLRVALLGPGPFSMLDALRERGATIEDVQAVLELEMAVDLVLVDGVRGSMAAGAFRRLAECIVWIGGKPSVESDLVDGSLARPDIDELTALLPALYPERLAI